MAVLYRDYRPKRFSEIIGQDAIKKVLQNSVAAGSVAHAYLFTGPRGTGKTSSARIFARAINCLKPAKGEPCNVCEICIQFLDAKTLDFVEIDAASNTGIENVREIIETLKFFPSLAKYKVFVIDEIHMLSKGAFNALLKTLEEPPEHAIFILATTEIHKVPATVISRTQRFDFRRIESGLIYRHLLDVSKLEKISVAPAALQIIADSAEGSIRDALSILDKVSAFGEIGMEEIQKLLGVTNVKSAQRLAELLINRDAKGALDYFQELLASGVDPVQFNKDFLEYLRRMLMVAMGSELNFAMDKEQMNILEKHSGKISHAHLLNIIRLFLKANKDFQISPSAELPVEIAIAEASLAGNTVSANHTDARKTAAEPEREKSEKKANANISTAEQNEKTPGISKTKLKNISLDRILEEWPAVLEKIKLRQGSLLAVMKTVKVAGISEENKVIFLCSYKFHQDSLQNSKHKAILEQILSEHFGTVFYIEAQLENAPEANKGQDPSALAIEILGGELI